ncbi:unnamed protein product [Caenorhabditis auriculariae]|uniref:Uncharacterized protein n=1 Tax=Caenorhabditis auriculariae TaxID=2777116 RepID=A0A8S1GX18_9PELO|nr:unnamed protein product [Caenorhabditis auriculariae]
MSYTPTQESYQSVLPSHVSSGWNDPPAFIPTSNSPNRLASMRQRPIDPSIMGGRPAMTTGYGQQMYGGNQQYGMPAQNQQVPQGMMGGSAQGFSQHASPAVYGAQTMSHQQPSTQQSHGTGTLPQLSRNSKPLFCNNNITLSRIPSQIILQ